MMTRQQIIDALRVANPDTELDGVRHAPGSDVYEATLQRWADALEAQEQPNRKIWETVQQFLSEFTLPELAAIWSSEDPTIGALTMILLSWRNQVWSDDARIVQGISALVAAGILSSERATTILTTNG